MQRKVCDYWISGRGWNWDNLSNVFQSSILLKLALVIINDGGMEVDQFSWIDLNEGNSQIGAWAASRREWGKKLGGVEVDLAFESIIKGECLQLDHGTWQKTNQPLGLEKRVDSMLCVQPLWQGQGGALHAIRDCIVARGLDPFFMRSSKWALLFY